MKKNSTILDTIILSLMIALLVIGAHQTWILSRAEGFKIAFFKNYYLFMLILVLMAIYQIRKNKREKLEKEETDRLTKIEKKKGKKGPKSI